MLISEPLISTYWNFRYNDVGSPHLFVAKRVLPPLSVGEMTLRLYAALNYSQNGARDLRRTLNGV